MLFAVLMFCLFPVSQGGCGKTALKRVVMQENKSSVLTIQQYKDLVADKDFSVIYELVHVNATKPVEVHYGMNLTITSVPGNSRTYERQIEFDRENGGSFSCVRDNATMYAIHATKAIFHVGVRTDLNIQDMTFSSCPKSYLLSVFCYNADARSCPVEKAVISLRVPKKLGELDDLQLSNIADDLFRNTKVRFGEHIGLKSIFVHRKNSC